MHFVRRFFGGLLGKLSYESSDLALKKKKVGCRIRFSPAHVRVMVE